MNNRPPLRPYQATGVEFLRRTPRAFLGDDMGLGKTRQIIEATEGRALVVAPSMVLAGGTWAEEVERWDDDPDRFTMVPYTSILARGERNTVLDRLRPEYDQNWDTLILDEAHYIKNKDARWTKALIKLANKKVGRVILATGTPIPHWPQELWTPLLILHHKEARPGGRFGSYWKWAGRWFDTEPETIRTKGGGERTVRQVGQMLGCTAECFERPPTDPCPHYVTFHQENLGGLFLQRLRDDVLTDLPPLTRQQILCPMEPAQAKAYRLMKKDWLAELSTGELKVAWSASARHVMMDQLATGLEVLDPTGASSSGKLARLRVDLESRSRPTLVVGHYRPTVEACARVARELGARVAVIHGGVSMRDRARVVADFKAGRVDVLCASLTTIAEGLTLTQADMIIFVEQSYTPSRNLQAERRIHRLGQERPCTLLDYLTPDSVDEGKREVLANKTDAQVRTLSPAQFFAMA